MPRTAVQTAYDAYLWVTDRISPTFGARIDGLIPALRNSWGGSLNGQRHRRGIVRELHSTIDFDRVLETGTFRGSSTEFFAAVTGRPVATVEANPRFYAYSRSRLAYLADEVSVFKGDSREFLRDQAADAPTSERVFVYLDAHWADDLPLCEEVEIIADNWTHAVVMIDDFEVPGDPGYAFDDYGPGKRLTADHLPNLSGWKVLYPAMPSDRESGARRGCVVLVSPALSGLVGTLETLTERGFTTETDC